MFWLAVVGIKPDWVGNLWGIFANQWFVAPAGAIPFGQGWANVARVGNSTIARMVLVKNALFIGDADAFPALLTSQGYAYFFGMLWRFVAIPGNDLGPACVGNAPRACYGRGNFAGFGLVVKVDDREVFRPAAQVAPVGP